MKHSPSLPAGMSVAIFLIVTALTGCYPGYYGPPPVSFDPTPSVQSGDDGVRITVIPSYWTGTPRNLPRFVTPFYVEIENFSQNALSVSYEDIVLFDQFRTQYSPISPEAVADIISTSDYRYAAYPSYPNISIGIGSGFYGGPWGYYRPFYRPFGYYAFNSVWYYPPPVYYYPVPVSTKDVVTGALVPGTVYPNASLKGYVYFRQMPDEVSQVTLNVGYVNGGNQEFRSLSFPFSAASGGY